MTFRGARRHSLFDIRDCAVATSWAIERVEGSSFPCGAIVQAGIFCYTWQKRAFL